MTLTVEVLGLPVAQGRPRAARFGAGVRLYDPAKSKDWKRTVHYTVAEKIAPESHRFPLQGPLVVTLRFSMPRPKSLPKRVQHHTKRPDLDNCAKAVMDALNGLVYRDDSQVWWLDVSKCYSDRPGVRIEVKESEST